MAGVLWNLPLFLLICSCINAIGIRLSYNVLAVLFHGIKHTKACSLFLHSYFASAM